MLVECGILVIGLILLYAGSELLVRGASSTAMLFAVRPVIIGLTIVAFATSAPELIVSLVAAVKGSGDISIGNILGSNVINIALVLGISSLIKPVEINRNITRFEIPYMVFASIIFWLFCLDGTIGYRDGLILIFILIVFLAYGFKNARDKNNEQSTAHYNDNKKYDNDDENNEKLKIKDKKNRRKSILINTIMLTTGLAGLAKGADMVVNSAINLATAIGLSQAFIGISVVALGTSLPELAASAVAASKGESDISIGNVVGSNLFNICLVMGMVGFLNPMSIDKSILNFEFPAMLLISFILFGIAFFCHRITRKTGIFLIIFFIVYIVISYFKTT